MERMLVGEGDVRPSMLGLLDAGILLRVQQAFDRGRFLEELPPVTLLVHPESGLLLPDGHHRLTMASLRGVKIWGEAFGIGERYHTPSGELVTVTKRAVDQMLWLTEHATKSGNDTFLNLYKNSFKDTLNIFRTQT